MENDIKNQLNNIQSYYTENSNNVRYKIFSQTAAIYSMFLDDKKALQKKQYNIAMFKDQLQKCQIGFKDNQNKMNLKTATQRVDVSEPPSSPPTTPASTAPVVPDNKDNTHPSQDDKNAP